jgi:hypothetical protein
MAGHSKGGHGVKRAVVPQKKKEHKHQDMPRGRTLQYLLRMERLIMIMIMIMIVSIG